MRDRRKEKSALLVKESGSQRSAFGANCTRIVEEKNMKCETQDCGRQSRKGRKVSKRAAPEEGAF